MVIKVPRPVGLLSQLFLFVQLLASARSQLTPAQKTFLLDKHNEMRGRVVPTAADMRKLVWDSRLESVAQAYAAKCVWRHNQKATEEFHAVGGEKVYVGENLHANTDYDVDRILATGMDNFFNEREFYDFNTRACSKEPCGHYTQVVWSTSKAVGCAVHYCKDGIPGTPWPHLAAYKMVCNYSPAGNWRGRRPYKAGAPCSQCPSDAQQCVNGLCTASAEPEVRPTAVAAAAGAGDQQVNHNILSRLEALEKRNAASDNVALNRPSAHLDGNRKEDVTVDSGAYANFWTSHGYRAHLRGGFAFREGRLIVPQTGYYFVYSQLWHKSASPVLHVLYANRRRLAVASAASGSEQTTWAGGVFRLTKGDVLRVRIGKSGGDRKYTVFSGGAHSYMGAFMV